jgi:DNA-binding MarR family transcriptional regulator
MSDRDAELDAMLDVLEQAGLVESYIDEEGKDAMRLTVEGAKVARQMALSSEDDQEALLAALVEAAEEEN